MRMTLPSGSCTGVHSPIDAPTKAWWQIFLQYCISKPYHECLKGNKHIGLKHVEILGKRALYHSVANWSIWVGGKILLKYAWCATLGMEGMQPTHLVALFQNACLVRQALLEVEVTRNVTKALFNLPHCVEVCGAVENVPVRQQICNRDTPHTCLLCIRDEMKRRHLCCRPLYWRKKITAAKKNLKKCESHVAVAVVRYNPPNWPTMHSHRASHNQTPTYPLR